MKDKLKMDNKTFLKNIGKKKWHHQKINDFSEKSSINREKFGNF